MYGGAIMSDAGLVASSDYKGFSKYEFVTEYIQAGNVRTFFTSCSSMPVVFINSAENVAASILAIRKVSGGHYVDILSDGLCSLIIFAPLTASPSGYGLAFFDASGSPTYISSMKMLALKAIGTLSEIVTMSAPGNSFSYSAAHLYGTKTERTDLVSAGTTLVNIWGPVSTYICEWKDVYTWTSWYEDVNTQVCVWKYVSTWGNWYIYGTYYDYSKNTYVMGYHYENGYKDVYTNVCEWKPVSTRKEGFKYIRTYVCEWKDVYQWIPVTSFIWASVRTTNWAIYRGAAFFSNGYVKFRWVLHKSGFYKDVLTSYLDANTDNLFILSQNQLMAAYQQEQAVGELTSGSNFPYTNVTSNLVPTQIAILSKEDYV